MTDKRKTAAGFADRSQFLRGHNMACNNTRCVCARPKQAARLAAEFQSAMAQAYREGFEAAKEAYIEAYYDDIAEDTDNVMRKLQPKPGGGG